MPRIRQPLCPKCKVNLKAPGQGYCYDCRKISAKEIRQNRHIPSIRPIKEYLRQPAPPTEVKSPELTEALVHDPLCGCLECRITRGEISVELGERFRCQAHAVIGCAEVRCQVQAGAPR